MIDPRRPTRRDLLALTASGVAGLCGCLGEGDDASDEEANGTTNPGNEVPTHPSSYDEDVLREFVANYERAVQYERYLDNDARSGTSMLVTCRGRNAVVNFTAEDEWYVTVNACSLTVDSDEPNGTERGTTDPVLYLVTREDVTRIDPRTEQYDEPYLTDEQPSSQAPGVWTSNFDDEAHELSVTITHLEESDPVLERTFELAPERGVHLKRVAGVPGEYDWEVQVADGPRETATVPMADHGPSSLPMGAAIVTPASELLVDEIEFTW